MICLECDTLVECTDCAAKIRNLKVALRDEVNSSLHLGKHRPVLGEVVKMNDLGLVWVADRWEVLE